MMKNVIAVIVTTIISVILTTFIVGIFTIIRNPDEAALVFVLFPFNIVIPFLLGVTVYHIILKLISSKLKPAKSSFLRLKVALGLFTAMFCFFAFVVLDILYSELDRPIQVTQIMALENIVFVIVSGIIVSIVHHKVLAHLPKN